MKFFLFLIILCCSIYFLWELLNQRPQDLTEHRQPVKRKALQKNAPIRILKEKVNSYSVIEEYGIQRTNKKLVTTLGKSDSTINWEEVDTLESIEDGHLVDIVKIEGQEIIHGDILIPKHSKRVGKRVLLNKPKIWKKGIIPYTIEKSLPNYDDIKTAIDYINQETNVNFINRKNSKDYVAFVKGDKNCYSAVGRNGGKQLITLSPLCDTGAIIHEMVHTIGFYHEQNRIDRNKHIEVFWGNIEKKFWPQFKIIQTESTLNTDTPFDFKSIMLYPPTFFAKDKKFATMASLDGELYEPYTEELSYWDIEEINMLYPAR